MKVTYYCQHVLGIGHFHRSMEICKAIARRHPITLIVGGPPVEVNQPGIQVLQLPGLQMDSQFGKLIPCRGEEKLEDVKAVRREQLFAHFKESRPDIFITELYPFGRKAFRFELEPLLQSVREGSLSDCSCFCSVRDILVEKKTGREKFEQRVVETVNDYFSGILVHADPEIITLDETFGRMDDIKTPLHYTGFVTKPEIRGDRDKIRRTLGLSATDRLIVASIGGGNVGGELLEAVIRAFGLIEKSVPAYLQLFCGPYLDDTLYTVLQSKVRDRLSVNRFTDRFPEWLAAADLSISMAGYNTCMNLIQAGIPALVYPFRQNREQRLRAERLGRKVPMKILEETDLFPAVLAEKMTSQLYCSRSSSNINLNGAEETVRKLTTWYTHPKHHE